jgi:hypothetical protein
MHRVQKMAYKTKTNTAIIFSMPAGRSRWMLTLSEPKVSNSGNIEFLWWSENQWLCKAYCDFLPIRTRLRKSAFLPNPYLICTSFHPNQIRHRNTCISLNICLSAPHIPQLAVMSFLLLCLRIQYWAPTVAWLRCMKQLVSSLPLFAWSDDVSPLFLTLKSTYKMLHDSALVELFWGLSD